MLTRRSLLALLAGVPVVATAGAVRMRWGGSDAPSVAAPANPGATATPTPKPSGPSRVIVPNTAADPIPPTITLSATDVLQGSALEVRVDPAERATVSVLGRTYDLAPDGTGGVSGTINITTDDPPGPAALAVAIEQPAGLQFSEERTFQIVAPALAADGPPPVVTLSTLSVYQGGAIRVVAANAASGVAYVFGRAYPLAAVEGGAAGFVGFGTEDPPGPATVIVEGADFLDEPFSLARDFDVLPTDWTVDYIDIPPSTPDPDEDPTDPNAPTPPPPPPDEGPLLPGIYAGLTPRKWLDTWAAPLDVMTVTGYFGEQRSFNGGPVQGHHGGTDLGANAGTPIHSTNDGVVVMSGRYLVRGNLVVVDHGTGIFSLYGHMQERVVAVGDVVSQGEVLGYVGSTGLSTGPHLHWEMSVSGVLVDALRWLDGSQGF